MVDRAFLALAVLGTLACLGVHAAAWLGFAPSLEATFTLFSGCLLVWWRAIRAARAAFQTRGATGLWNAVTARCPSWVKYGFQPLTFYFMVYWAWVLYVILGLRAKPSPELWARFYSAGAIVFYFFGATFLWAARVKLLAEPSAVLDNKALQQTKRGQDASFAAETPRLRRAAIFGTIVGLLASAAWFLPRLDSLPFMEGGVERALHVAVLLLVASGTGAVFGAVIAGFSSMLGTSRVISVLFMVNLLAFPYGAWRKGQPVTSDVWLEGVLWGVGFASFGIAASRLARPGGDQTQGVT